MKKAVLVGIMVVMAMVSCTTQTEIVTNEKQVNEYAIDLGKYSQEGFFVSQSDYFGDFKPIRIVEMEFVPETSEDVNLVGKWNEHAKMVFDTIRSNTQVLSEWNLQEAMDKVVEKGKKLGADGIVNVKFRFENKGFIFIGGMYINRK